ncbi:MAG: 30S ribosomal protein S6 [Mycoplasmataceae bacterium]|nr:30S ribosomal protein S6 [Mycoplasmataceae bacterium]
MANYEINLLINGSLDEQAAKQVFTSIDSLIRDEKHFKLDNWGVKPTAYPIKHQNSAYYLIYTFETEDSSKLLEFRRLANLNKDVLRCLIINLGKNYGHRASINPKKAKHAATLFAAYEKHKDERKKMIAESAEFETLEPVVVEEVKEVKKVVRRRKASTGEENE